MSVETILKANKVKQRKKKPRLTIQAVDEKYTGSEPVWDGWQDWPIEKFWKEWNRSFNFYNYYSDAKSLKPNILTWMEANGYKKEEIRAVKNAPDWLPGQTVGTLCTCMNRGMPALHEGLQAYANTLSDCPETILSAEVFVRERIKEAIHQTIQESPSEAPGEASKREAISPMDRLKAKVSSTILLDLDVWLDESLDKNKVEPLAVYERMQHHGLPAAAVNQVETWLNRYLPDMKAAYDKTDEDLVEAYSFLSKKQFENRISVFEEMLNDLNKYKLSAKATRAPRAKKTKPAEKQVEKLKYLKHDQSLKITSITPVRIVSARRVLVYNTKYRMLCSYESYSTQGITVKGTSLKNLDETLCKNRKLRKPEEFLSIAMKSTEKQFDKAWDKLTTREGKPNGRINEETLILRVFN